MNEARRDLGSVLRAIAEEDGSAARTAERADAELAALTARIRRRRTVTGAVTAMGAVAAAALVAVVAVQGLDPAPDARPAVGPGPVPTAVPTQDGPSPTPSATPAPPPPDPARSGPAAPPVTQEPAQAPTDPEATARGIVAEYLDAWRDGRTEALEAMTAPTGRPVTVASYTLADTEPSCRFVPPATLWCDVVVLEGDHFMVRVTVERDADGQWWATAGEFGVG